MLSTAANALAGEGDSLLLNYDVDEGERPSSFPNFVRGGFGATRPSEADTDSPYPHFQRYERGFRPNSFELSKQHVLSDDDRVNTWKSGWRFDAFVDDGSFGVGQEVSASGRRAPIWNVLRARDAFRGFERQTYVSGGLRINDYQSSYDFLWSSSILGETGARVENDHLAIGPQIGLGAVAQNKVWRLEALMLGFAGYQHTDYELNGAIGQELVPGALNRPVNGRTTETTIVGPNEDDVAWAFETRLTAGAQLTKHWRFDTTWRWAVVGPIYDASSSIGYTLPTLGLTRPNGDDEYVSDLFLGLTYLR